MNDMLDTLPADAAGQITPCTDYSTIPPRPRNTDAIKRAAAEATDDEVIKACADDMGDREDVIADIDKACRVHKDGYQNARDLERWCHWDCDMVLCEALDSYGSHYSDAERVEQEKWVTRNNVQAALVIGQRVRVPDGEVGAITGVYQHGPAKYLVRLDSETHPNSQRIENFEDVQINPTDGSVA